MKGLRDYLENISKAQAIRQVGQGSTYLLVIRAREIVCIPKKMVHEGEFVLGTVTEWQCSNGLTESDWHSIELKIAQALKEKRL